MAMIIALLRAMPSFDLAAFDLLFLSLPISWIIPQVLTGQLQDPGVLQQS